VGPRDGPDAVVKTENPFTASAGNRTSCNVTNALYEGKITRHRLDDGSSHKKL